MIKPYYEENGITIYHGDCKDILPELSAIDLTIMDPPYGINYFSNRYKKGNPYNKIKGDSSYPIEIINICREISSNAVYAFCRWENLQELPKPKSFIVWIKNNWTAGDLKHAHGRQWEGICFFPGGRHL